MNCVYADIVFQCALVGACFESIVIILDYVITSVFSMMKGR